MKFWTGASADEAARKVTTNASWIGELGHTAQEMSGPIQDAGGALRSAGHHARHAEEQLAGDGAAAGFASAFGFGSSKRKLKRKAVQTMQRYEGALLGIDQTTPQFGDPTDGTNPGDDSINNPGPGFDEPGTPPTPPGAGPSPDRPDQQLPGPVRMPDGPNDYGTDPSFAGSPEGRWQSLTGLGPGSTANVGGGGGSGVGGGLGDLSPFGGLGAGAGRGSDYRGGGRFRLAGDDEWLSVNPLPREEIRPELRRLAARTR